ncbi:myb-like protein AA isoform X1 [Drosophila miranda]|uniref:myb-like protein AA isoform X1 n=1 Tax=Drosophila miranda TaxID=7229 RepID=UPI00143FB7D0|nr:myb-like protein AA isoform X1 [Drosophila miranda]
MTTALLTSASAMYTHQQQQQQQAQPSGRNSILKQQGSVKGDKRVSIQQTSSSNHNNNNNNNNNAKSATNVEYISEGAGSKVRLTAKPPAGPRPASLIITRSDSSSQFQLLRSSSVDYDDVEAQEHRTTIRTTLLEQQEEDEAAPFVFTARK